jgi:hypothetical protein
LTTKGKSGELRIITLVIFDFFASKVNALRSVCIIACLVLQWFAQSPHIVLIVDPMDKLHVIYIVFAVTTVAPQEMPPGPRELAMTAEDSNLERYFATFSISFKPGSSSINTCKFVVRIGISTDDKTGPIIDDNLVNNSGFPADTAITKTYTDIPLRLYDGKTIPSVKVTTSDEDNDGIFDYSIASTGKWTSDAGESDKYLVLVTAYNCEGLVNPEAASVPLSDKCKFETFVLFPVRCVLVCLFFFFCFFFPTHFLSIIFY